MPDGIDSLLFVVALVSTVAITARTVATVIGQRPYQTVHTKFQRRVLWTNVVQYASMTVAGMIGQNILSAGTNMMAGDAAICYINAHAIFAASRSHSNALPIIRLALQVRRPCVQPRASRVDLTRAPTAQATIFFNIVELCEGLWFWAVLGTADNFRFDIVLSWCAKVI